MSEKPIVINTKTGWRGEVLKTRTCCKKPHRDGKRRCSRYHEQLQAHYFNMPSTVIAACGGDTFGRAPRMYGTKGGKKWAVTS